MNTDSLTAVRIVAIALGDLRDEVMFVGGVVPNFLITDPAAPPIRPTADVDIVIDIASYAGYVRLSKRLRNLGFSEDSSDGAPACRWVVGGIKVDVMSSGPHPGPANRWYQEALSHAESIRFDADLTLRLITAPYFIATKLDAFGDGRRGDYRDSRDLEDIIAIVDGRESLVVEVASAPQTVADFLRERLNNLLSDPDFIEALPGLLWGDSASQARLPLIVGRLRAMAAKR